MQEFIFFILLCLLYLATYWDTGSTFWSWISMNNLGMESYQFELNFRIAWTLKLKLKLCLFSKLRPCTSQRIWWSMIVFFVNLGKNTSMKYIYNTLLLIHFILIWGDCMVWCLGIWTCNSEVAGTFPRCGAVSLYPWARYLAWFTSLNIRLSRMDRI